MQMLKCADDAKEYEEPRSLYDKINVERAHLAQYNNTRNVNRHKRDRSMRNKNPIADAMGHFSKMEYYVPKGKAGRFSGMYIAKETGEML